MSFCRHARQVRQKLGKRRIGIEHTRGEDGGSSIHHALNLYQNYQYVGKSIKKNKSDYFINGTKVRRRDVVDIFGHRSGARSYAVIEQGAIGRSLMPMRLRATRVYRRHRACRVTKVGVMTPKTTRYRKR